MLCRATEWKEEEESRPPPGIHRSLAQDFDAAYQEQQQALARAASPVDGPCMETLIEDAEVEPDQVTEDAEEPECSSPLCGPMPSPSSVPCHGHGHSYDQQLASAPAADGSAQQPMGDKEEDEDLVTPNARGPEVPEETPMAKASRPKRKAASAEPEPVEPKPKRAKAAAKKGAAKRAMKRPAARSVAENSGAAEEQPIEDGAVDNAIEPSGPIEDVAVENAIEPSAPIGNMAVENVIEPSAPIENMAVENVIEPPVPVEAATEPLAGEGAVAHQIAEAPVMDGEASPGHGGDGVPEDVVVEAPRGRGRGRGRGGRQQGLSEENRQICRELVQHGRDFMLELYWTRSVIGVRQKLGTQIWSMRFKNMKVDILVANEVVNLCDRGISIHGEDMTNAISNYREELEEQHGEVWP
ncbi:unnamed protein product [Symbiodinium sp. KB8]|nr:unnamed protein product [Symbiodinium sp. KB8]